MNIAIWGLGVSGISTLKALIKEGKHQVSLIDRDDPREWKRREEVLGLVSEEQCYSQNNLVSLEEQIDLIIMAPGIDPRIPELQAFHNIPKVCEVEYFYQYIDKPIIAITGTNGKTTTCTLLKLALERAGKKVFLGGNIGIPLAEAFLSENEYDYYVLELSSFQLELIDRFNADISVILNISESHMERYDSFGQYRDAKYRITMNQKESEHLMINEDSASIESQANMMKINPVQGYDFSQSKLVGEHYKLNFDVVDKVLSLLAIEKKKEIIQFIINDFSGVRYRLEFLRRVGSVSFYNDSKSTNLASTLSALSAFQYDRVYLIMGGKLRQEDVTSLGEELNRQTQIEKIFAFGEAKSLIRKEADKLDVIEFSTLKDVILNMHLLDVDVVLFSPGFPSFDQYTNYIERGDDFENLVRNLF